MRGERKSTWDRGREVGMEVGRERKMKEWMEEAREKEGREIRSDGVMEEANEEGGLEEGRE